MAEPPIYQNIRNPRTFRAESGYLGICVFVNDIKRAMSIREQRNQEAEKQPNSRERQVWVYASV